MRAGALQMKRSVARFVDPAILPDRTYSPQVHDQDPSLVLPVSYSSLTSRGVLNLQTRFMLQAFPPFAPWFEHRLNPWIEFNPSIDSRLKFEAQQQLFAHDLTLQAMIESAPFDIPNRQAVPFRSAIGQAIMSGIVVGEACIQCLPTMQIRSHSLNNYVVERDESGAVRAVALRERIDPMELDDERRAKLGVSDAEWEKKSVEEREMDLWTVERWEPGKREWVLRQEVGDDGIEIYGGDGTKYPEFVIAPWRLHPGQMHGTGFAETNYGDIFSLSVLDEMYLRYAANATRFHPTIGPDSGLTPKDFTKKSGTPFVTKMEGGKATKIGFLTLDKGQDFSIVQVVREAKRRDLGQSMLLDSEVAGRGGEAFRHSSAWATVVNENNMLMGSSFIDFQESLSMGLCRRMRWQMREAAKRDRQRRWLLLDEEEGGSLVFSERPVLLTGLAALKRQNDKQKLLEFGQWVNALGQADAIKPDVATAIYARYDNLDISGIIKSPAEREAERQAMVRTQTQIAAGQEGSRALANVVEQSLSPAA
jgi:hypothetical protein